LIDKIVRTKVYQSKYYTEQCFALNETSLIDRAIGLEYIGCYYGGMREPSPFICLIVKMLQICPERQIVLEYIKQEDSKYLRALGMFYWRLT